MKNILKTGIPSPEFHEATPAYIAFECLRMMIFLYETGIITINRDLNGNYFNSRRS